MIHFANDEALSLQIQLELPLIDIIHFWKNRLRDPQEGMKSFLSSFLRPDGLILIAAMININRDTD